MKSTQQDIAERFTERAQAERYRDRFKRGRRRQTHEREANALRELLGTLGRKKVILDVGSGAGRFASVFAPFASRLIQTDFSIHMLEVSREDGAGQGADTSYVQSDARSLPLASGSVDVIFCHRLLNHLPPEDRGRVFAHFARVARECVIISCLMPPAPLRFIRRFSDRLRGRVSKDGHVDAQDVLRDAETAGLSLVGRTPIRLFPVSGAFYTLAKSAKVRE